MKHIDHTDGKELGIGLRVFGWGCEWVGFFYIAMVLSSVLMPLKRNSPAIGQSCYDVWSSKCAAVLLHPYLVV
jgi:hypothetical protein